MSTLKTQATKNLEETLKSEEFKSYHSRKRAGRLLLARIKEILDNEKITHAELAEKTGMARSSITRLLNGGREDFSYNTMAIIAESLGYTFEIRKRG